MKLPIIDADGHVLEPMGRLLGELPRALRERAESENEHRRPSRDQIEYSLGSLCTPGSLAQGGRLDMDFEIEVDRGSAPRA